MAMGPYNPADLQSIAGRQYADAPKGYSGPVEAKETPFSRLSRAVDRLRETRSRASEVACSLCGERGPSPANASGKINRAPIVGLGMLGGIEDLAQNIEDIVDDMNDDLARVARHI